MKEITRIHLAQTPFNIELSAKKELEKYLAAIEKTLADDDDTLREIEARIIELLGERGVSEEKVVTMADIKAVKEQLGAPAEFVDEQDAVVEVAGRSKRLMRNTERGLLGGVSAGIADYFGVNVMWPRLVAILLTLISFGTAVLVYVVLWLVIPPAKTAAEKLQMRGEPVTLATLKDEARNVAENAQERSKPLVIILRVLLGLGFVAAAIGAVGAVILAIFAREPLFGASMHDLVTNDTLAVLGGAYVAAIIAGLLFAALMILAAYASFAWMMSKRLLISGGLIIVLGVASFATAVTLGIYGSGQVNQRIEQSRATETTTAPQLDVTAKRLVVTNSAMPIEYRVTTGKPSVDVQYLRGQKKPEVMMARDGDTVKVTVKLDGNCGVSLMNVCNSYDSVVINGPALDGVELAEGSLTYRAANQSSLVVTTRADVQLTLDGVIDTLHANLADNSTLVADTAAVNTGDVTVGRDSSTAFGVLSRLTLATPSSCAAHSRADVSIKRVTYLKELDYVTQQSEIRENCTTITIDEPSPTVLN